MSLSTEYENHLIVLKNQTSTGELLEATFLPEKGMNMISFKKGGLEVIDQSTKPLFEERFAGLGALIGPHFHRRLPEVLPTIQREDLFPHIARVRAKGTQDPFSHGIGRYAPWKVESTEHRAKATLSGKDLWNGVALSTLEGQDFSMKFEVDLLPSGLDLSLSVVSEADSLVGIHYYYFLPSGKGKIISNVQDKYIEQGEFKTVPSSFLGNSQHSLVFDLEQEADYTFFPFPDSSQGKIVLETDLYRLQTSYSCVSQESSWQLYHPKGSSFVCIEPISAQDPRHPNLTVSSINIQLQILDL